MRREKSVQTTRNAQTAKTGASVVADAAGAVDGAVVVEAVLARAGARRLQAASLEESLANIRSETYPLHIPTALMSIVKTVMTSGKCASREKLVNRMITGKLRNIGSRARSSANRPSSATQSPSVNLHSRVRAPPHTRRLRTSNQRLQSKAAGCARPSPM